MIVVSDTLRTAALALLWRQVERVIEDESRVAVLAWVAARETDDGGFLWLAALLGCRPSVLAATLQEMATTPPAQLSGLRMRLRWVWMRRDDDAA